MKTQLILGDYILIAVCCAGLALMMFSYDKLTSEPNAYQECLKGYSSETCKQTLYR
jgi:hypothetical protein